MRRLEEGILGYIRNLGQGIIELKIDYGPGYRVYLGFADNDLAIILVIGDKRTQQKDIPIAKNRWVQYQEQKNEE